MVANLRYKFLFYFIFIVLLACKDNNSDQDHLVFRYNEHSNISSLDPIFAKNLSNIWPCNQLFNGLVQLDDNLNIQPDIATHWEISEDATTYTFHLRKDVYFHKSDLFKNNKTRSVNAKDFEFSLNRLCDIKWASPGSWLAQNVMSYYAESDYVLKIQLKQPFPAFIGTLSMKYCSVVPKEVVNHYGNDFGRNPIGTGPFKFKRWLENTKLVLRKNELYYEKDENGKQLPYLEAVAITFLPDKQSEFLEFAQGNIDFISGLDPSYKDEILTSTGKLRKKYSGEKNIISGAYLNTEYLGFYMDSETSEIQSELLRKAVNYGFDRQKMITFLRNGIGTPAENGFIPKGLPSFNGQKGFTYDLNKAKHYIEEYKKQTGNSSPKITISTNSAYVDLCEYIQRELEKIGMEVRIDLLTPSTLKQEKANGKLDCFRASWIADYPDAENYLSLFYSKNFAPNGPNYMHFKDELFDQWYEQALLETQVENRQALYQKMDSLIIAQAPVIPLYYDQVIRFSGKNIDGLGINPINLLQLKKVKKSK
ncbi:MAG: ABC transporter substrate-binding protein [Flavobacteriaceae bacterium]|nr:ABC transporter substrate-binding protein [Flavobacteriaceae bacterium]